MKIERTTVMNHHDPELIEELARVSHDAYECAATRHGWVTQAESRTTWDAVPERNQLTVLASIAAVLDRLTELGWGPASS